MGMVFEAAKLRELPDLARVRDAAGRAAAALPAEGFAAALERTADLPPPTAAERIVVLGIGGSALGARAVHEACARPGLKPVVVVDNIDAALLEEAWSGGAPEKTAWVVVSKSGGTTETLAQWGIVRERLHAEGVQPEIHVVTGRSGPLRELAAADALPVHEVPEEVGGRFSAFTPAATVPLALAGHDVAALLLGARAARDHCARAAGVTGGMSAPAVGDGATVRVSASVRNPGASPNIRSSASSRSTPIVMSLP